MNTNRDRSAILADINEMQAQGAVAGTLTMKTRKLADGTTAVYHQIQRWDRRTKRNVTIHVPADKVEAVKAGLERHGRLGALLDELAAADIGAVLSRDADDPLKKKRLKSSAASPGRSRKSP